VVGLVAAAGADRRGRARRFRGRARRFRGPARRFRRLARAGGRGRGGARGRAGGRRRGDRVGKLHGVTRAARHHGDVRGQLPGGAVLLRPRALVTRQRVGIWIA